MTIRTIIDEGKAVYEKIRSTLEIKFPNQYVVIDPISKEYFIDASMGVALAKAKSRFPDREFYTIQIGRPAAMSLSR